MTSTDVLRPKTTPVGSRGLASRGAFRTAQHRQPWTSDHAKAVLALPPVQPYSVGSSTVQLGQDNKPRSRLEATEQRLQQRMWALHGSSEREALFERIRREDARKRADRIAARQLRRDFLTENLQIADPLETRMLRLEDARVRQERLTSAVIKRNVLATITHRRRLMQTSETQNLRRLRDQAMVRSVSSLVSQKTAVLQKEWLILVVAACGADKLRGGMQRHGTTLERLKIMRASRVITRVIRLATQVQRRHKAADVLQGTLSSLFEMSRVKRFVNFLLWSVRVAQRVIRQRRFVTEEHLRVMRVMWAKVWMKVKVERTVQLTQLEESLPKEEKKVKKSSGKKQGGRTRKDSVAYRNSSTPAPAPAPAESPVLRKPTIRNVIQDIPEDIQNQYLYAWLVAQRQQYVLECCRFERFEVFPILIEVVAQVKGICNRREARKHSEKIRRRGFAMRYLRRHGVSIDEYPTIRRLPNEAEVRDMIRRAEDTAKARKQFFEDLPSNNN